jgi:hypothetical protein
VPSSRPCSRTPDQPRLLIVEEVHDRRTHRLWEGLVLGREHPAQAHPLALKDVAVELRVGAELGAGIDGAPFDLVERRGEARRVALDQRLPELGLACEVVVQARLRDPELLGHVGVAEPVEPAELHQPFGHVEDLGRGPALGLPSFGRHPDILPHPAPRNGAEGP